SDFRSIPGYGIEGVVGGRKVIVASLNYFSELDLDGEGSLIAISVDGELVGTVELEDLPKEEAFTTIRELKEMGYKVYMLTGDRRAVAEKLSRELGLDGFYSEVKPHEKVKVIKELQESGYYVVMVGDGVNDAPALVQADLGVAIGTGTDIAVESADVVLVRNDLKDVVHLLKLARSAYRKIVENIAWTIGYNSLTVPLAAGILAPLVISPAVGALMMSLSDILVVINANALN
ncbi:MAG: HAD-IC family P-type ATPase, partial [Candidatus Korarchaeum sp.]|nr:HAD-IC family P-type ATPase [Candidatus Korarchaeum sp.]MDW8036109.1 HAD-IC family P-type ATPase [Candidatus Korarchaeum sp.]